MPTPPLPVAERWWDRQEVAPGLWRLAEPHLDPLDRANVFLLKGRDRGLLVDGGMGVAPLRPALADLLDKPVLAVATHAHGDHVGGLHEFAERAVHRLEAGALADPAPGSLFAADFPPGFLAAAERAGYARPPELLITALPHAGYDPRSYRRAGAPATRLLAEGDTVGTGDRTFAVLHLPGHSRGTSASSRRRQARCSRATRSTTARCCGRGRLACRCRTTPRRWDGCANCRSAWCTAGTIEASGGSGWWRSARTTSGAGARCSRDPGASPSARRRRGSGPGSARGRSGSRRDRRRPAPHAGTSVDFAPGRAADQRRRSAFRPSAGQWLG